MPKLRPSPLNSTRSLAPARGRGSGNLDRPQAGEEVEGAGVGGVFVEGEEELGAGGGGIALREEPGGEAGAEAAAAVGRSGGDRGGHFGEGGGAIVVAPGPFG